MTTGIFLNTQELSELAGLNAGRHAVWPTEWTHLVAAGSPPSGQAGVAVSDSTLSAVAVATRRDPRCRGAIATITTAEAGTYTLDVDGDEYSFVATTEDAAGILAGLFSAILGSSYTPTLLDLNGDGVYDALYVRRTDLTSVASVSVVLGAAVFTIEASEVELRVWMLPTGLTQWCAVGTETSTITVSWVELIRTSIADRVYIEVVATDGACSWNVGPCAVTAGGT